MKALFYRLRFFYATCGMFLFIAALTLLTVEKIDGHVAINQTHTEFQDFFFKWFTYVGDGVFVAIGGLLLTLLFIRKKNGLNVFLLTIINLVLTGVVVQFLKQVVFSDALRPFGFIPTGKLYQVPGIDVHIFNSFPSGHTAAGFAFFTLVAFLFSKRPIIQFIAAICAVLIGYSRMYLSQHFLEDVFVGTLIGLGCFIISWIFLQKRASQVESL